MSYSRVMSRNINRLHEYFLYIFGKDNNNPVDMLLEITVRDFKKNWDFYHDIPQTSNNAINLRRIKKNLSIGISWTSATKFSRPKITTNERQMQTVLILANTVRIA